MFIDRIEKHPDLEDIIIVRDMHGAQVNYRMGEDSVLRPGRLWVATTKGSDPDYYRVTLFLPFPDGAPEVLKVEHNP